MKATEVAGMRDRGAAARTAAGPDAGDTHPSDGDTGLRTGAARPRTEPRVPGWLERAAGWAWRLLILGALIYATFRVVGTLRLVVLPCVAALLLPALLQPLTQRLPPAGLAAPAGRWCPELAALQVLPGAVCRGR